MCEGRSVDNNELTKMVDKNHIKIGLEDDLRLTRALGVTNYIDFYKYKVNFKLYK